MLRHPKLQRLTSMAVPALLAANAMVLVLGLATFTSEPAGADTVTYIKAADGTIQVVDPSTPEGWKAIAEARQRGEEVVTVPEAEAPPAVVEQQVAPTTTLLPGVTVPDVGQLVDDTTDTVVQTVDELGNTVDSVVDDVTDIVDDTAGTNVGDTVDPIVDDATDTLTTTVSTIAETVDDTVDDVVDTVSSVVSVPPVTTPTTAAPSVTVPRIVPIIGGATVTVPTTLPPLPGL
jgi:hypothetical protein